MIDSKPPGMLGSDGLVATTSRKSAPRGLYSGIVIAVVTVLFVFGGGWFIANSVLTDQADYESGLRHHWNHLGYEHRHIAQSIVRGNGFSDPFGYESGPTAWMPPLTTLVIASMLYTANDDVEQVAKWYSILQVFCIGVSFLPALVLAWRRDAYCIVVACCLLACVAYCSAIFQLTHDHPLQMLCLVGLYLHLCFEYRGRAEAAHLVAGATLAGLAALTGPAVATAWAIVLTVLLRRQPRRLVLAAAISLVVISPWMIRNRVVFGHWIPVKSNTAFEAWQGLVLDDDGVLDMRTLTTLHPLVRHSNEGQLYEALGESAYLAPKWSLWRQAVFNTPGKAIHGLAGRALAALVWYQPRSRDEQFRTWQLAVKRLWKILLLLSVLLITWIRVPIPGEIAIAIALWLFTIVPYIAISYYERYSWPTLPMQLLILGHAASQAFGLARTYFTKKHHFEPSLSQ